MNFSKIPFKEADKPLTAFLFYDIIICEPHEKGLQVRKAPASARLERGGIKMYAIVLTGGKQYKVEPGQVINVEKLDANVGDTVNLTALMVNKDGEIVCGDAAASVVVTGEVVAQDKNKKIIVFKYKSKKNERKRQGHRQPFTAIKINEIKA